MTTPGAGTPLRVLHVHSGNMYGGVETILVTLARHAAAAPDLAWRFALGWKGRLRNELAAAGAAPAIIGAARHSRPWTVWAARGQLRRLLEQQPCDVAALHSAWSLATFGPVFREAGLPVVWWMHSPLRGPGWLERRAARLHPARIVAVSRYTAQHVPHAFAGVPVDVVYAPVAAPAHVGTGRDALRHQLGAAPDQVLILHVGRMEASKGQYVLLEALAAVAARQWVCAFVGGAQRSEEADYQRRLDAAAVTLGLAGRVRTLGERSDVPALLDAADIIALPSTAPEGFSIALVEALYSGRAVVVTDLGPTPEIADDSCARLVRPGDAPALAKALDDLIADPAGRASLGVQGRARAADRCNPAAQLAQLEIAFRRAAHG